MFLNGIGVHSNDHVVQCVATGKAFRLSKVLLGSRQTKTQFNLKLLREGIGNLNSDYTEGLTLVQWCTIVPRLSCFQHTAENDKNIVYLLQHVDLHTRTDTVSAAEKVLHDFFSAVTGHQK